jgi:hypothetical protein
MQPDELEERHCRKEKNAMEKSQKSRCCKVDAVKVKVLPGGGLLDRPRRVAIYVLGTNPTPSRSRPCLLASKDKNY